MRPKSRLEHYWIGLESTKGKRRNDKEEVDTTIKHVDVLARLIGKQHYKEVKEFAFDKSSYSNSVLVEDANWHRTHTAMYKVFDRHPELAACVSVLSNIGLMAVSKGLARYFKQKDGKLFSRKTPKKGYLPCFLCTQELLMEMLSISIDQEKLFIRKLTSMYFDVDYKGQTYSMRLCLTFRKRIRPTDKHSRRFVYLNIPLLQYKIVEEEARRKREQKRRK